VRRVVVDPLFLPFAALLALALLGVVALASLLAPLTPRRRVLGAARLVLAYLRLDTGLLLRSAVLWLRSPVRVGPAAERRWTEAHTRLLHDALERLLAVAGSTVGFSVEVEEGSPVPAPGGHPLAVLARHAGPGDSFTLVWLILHRLRRTPRVVLKDVLLWDPGLDVVLTRLSCCFLSSRSGAGDDNTAAVAALAARLGPGDALLLFPEGGNWTRARQRRAVRRLFRKGRRRAAERAAAMPRVLPPRPAGTAAVLTTRPDAGVLVVAHGGLDALTSPRAVWSALPVDRTPMRVRWWQVPRDELPATEDAVDEWLTGQWERVARWVDGGSPAPARQDPAPSDPARQDPAR
jgi:1-acyl-sn-glycerol-3-phosphate acyltransferase